MLGIQIFAKAIGVLGTIQLSHSWAMCLVKCLFSSFKDRVEEWLGHLPVYVLVNFSP